MLGKKLINSGPTSGGGGANTFASENFNTVLYTGTGASQKIGGYINRGAIFNGSSSYIDINKKIPESLNFSVSFWFQTTSTATDQYIFSTKGNSTTNGWWIISHSGTIRYGEGNGSGANATTQISPASTYADGSWHHLVVTRAAGGTVNMYIDGGQVITNGSVGSNYMTSYVWQYDLHIGRYAGSANYYYNGKLDQARIFDKVLSSSEVTTLYGETFASTTKSTTDIFGDNSGVALYQFEGNANDTGGASGKFGAAAIFNGSTSVIDTGNVFSNNVSQITYSAWVNFENLNTQNFIMFPDSGSGDGFGFFDYGNGNVYFQSDNTTNSNRGYISNSGLYSTNQWVHFALVFDGTATGNSYRLKAYVNGNLLTLTFDGTIPSTTKSSSYNLLLGSRKLSGYALNGRIDEVRIYSNALTATEVGYIYNNTTASIPTNNLEAYYKLNGDARDEQQLHDGVATDVTYAYNGTASNVTYQEATNFQPDLVVTKSRTTAEPVMWIDSVRGGLTTRIFSDRGSISSQFTPDSISSFDSNGFTAEGGARINGSGANYVAWCWKGGNSTVSDTSGDVTASVSANADAGFSIVKYNDSSTSQQSVAHGLNAAPSLIITKEISNSNDWIVYTTAIDGGMDFLRLNTEAAASGSSLTVPTADFIYSRGSSSDIINYCFANVTDYQKIGTYTGNGSASGPLVETGFEPAFVMIKNTNGSDGWDRWYISDNKRLTDGYLYANETLTEQPYQAIEILSNGFRLITNDTGVNQSSNTYIYLAIAADPDTTTPTVENSFDVVTYTGTGSAGHKINTDFKPDLVWLKNRDATVNHKLLDSIRHDGTNIEVLEPNTTSASSGTTQFTSFDSDGFTLGGSASVYNASGVDYVAWCWKAGDHDDSIPQINTEGTIDSIVSVNAEAGFSIVKYRGTASVGATVGHGLSSIPELYIIKETSAADDWMVVAKIGNSYQRGKLQTTDIFSSSMSGVTNNVDPTSTVITLGNSGSVNQSGQDYIGYFFHSVTGHSKIGTYSGTGSAGNAQNIGFAPRFVMIKSYSGSTSNWAIFDTNRDGFKLNANDTSADYADVRVDLTSTGFQFTGGAYNTSGVNWIYLAFK